MAQIIRGSFSNLGLTDFTGAGRIQSVSSAVLVWSQISQTKSSCEGWAELCNLVRICPEPSQVKNSRHCPPRWQVLGLTGWHVSVGKLKPRNTNILPKLWFADWLFKNRNSQIAFYNGSPSLLNTKYWLGFSSEVLAGGWWLVAHHIKCDSRSQVVRKSVPVIVNISRHPSLDLQTSQPPLRTRGRHNKNNIIKYHFFSMSFLAITHNTEVTGFLFSVELFIQGNI